LLASANCKPYSRNLKPRSKELTPEGYFMDGELRLVKKDTAAKK
jgi:hypothetical protein